MLLYNNRVYQQTFAVADMVLRQYILYFVSCYATLVVSQYLI